MVDRDFTSFRADSTLTVCTGTAPRSFTYTSAVQAAC